MSFTIQRLQRLHRHVELLLYNTYKYTERSVRLCASVIVGIIISY